MSLRVSYSLVLFLIASWVAAAAKYDFNVGWKDVNPDGRRMRKAVAINNQWPNPTIRVRKGETLSVRVTNSLGSQETSLHWHGLFQRGTNQYDGPPRVVGCSIPPGMSFTYEFKVDQPGTYWCV